MEEMPIVIMNIIYEKKKLVPFLMGHPHLHVYDNGASGDHSNDLIDG